MLSAEDSVLVDESYASALFDISLPVAVQQGRERRSVRCMVCALGIIQVLAGVRRRGETRRGRYDEGAKPSLREASDLLKHRARCSVGEILVCSSKVQVVAPTIHDDQGAGRVEAGRDLRCEKACHLVAHRGDRDMTVTSSVSLDDCIVDCRAAMSQVKQVCAHPVSKIVGPDGSIGESALPVCGVCRPSGVGETEGAVAVVHVGVAKGDDEGARLWSMVRLLPRECRCYHCGSEQPYHKLYRREHPQSRVDSMWEACAAAAGYEARLESGLGKCSLSLSVWAGLGWSGAAGLRHEI